MGSIIFEQVDFSYSDQPIFKDLNVTFSGEGLTVILGRSGSGKSTLLALLGRLLVPTSGRITNTFSDKPALVFQSPLLLDYLTLEENVRLSAELAGKNMDQHSIEELFTSVGIDGLEDRSPSEVSGGEAMRASIARALATKSEVLVLDEPTGQLDEENSLKIYELLKDLAKKRLIILVTHDEKNAHLIADRLLLLQDGELLEIHGEETPPSDEKEERRREHSHLRIRSGFHIAERFLKHRKIRVLLSCFFLAFALSLLYLGLNLRTNLPSMMHQVLERFYSYGSCDIYKTTTIASSSSHLTLQRYEILDERELAEIGIEESYPSLSYFISDEREIFLNGITAAVRIIPVLVQDQDKILYGETMIDTFDVVVNTSFLNEFNLTEDTALDRKISFKEEKIVSVTGINDTDVFSQDYDLTIVGIASEKELFNSATIYYSYQKIYSYLDTIYLTDISEEYGSPLSVIDIFYKTDDLHDDFRSQKELIFIQDPISLRDELEESAEEITLSSKVLEIEESSVTISDSLATIVTIFLLLTLFSAFMLNFLMVFSLYDENIRIFALIYLYPDVKKNKRIIAGGTFIYLFLLTSLLFTIMSLVAAAIIDLVLARSGYPALLKIFDPLSYLLVSACSFMITLLASSSPLRRIRDSDIKRELESEE